MKRNNDNSLNRKERRERGGHKLWLFLFVVFASFTVQGVSSSYSSAASDFLPLNLRNLRNLRIALLPFCFGFIPCILCIPADVAVAGEP